MRNRVLLVDKRPSEFEALRKSLAAEGGGWEVEFCDSGRKALDQLASHPFDIVVSDVSVTDMNGTEFLRAVKADHPSTVRMLMSGHPDRDLDLGTGSIHQFVSRACTSDQFRKAVARAAKLHSLVQDPELSRLISQIRTLPSLPSLYMRIVEEMQAEDPSIRRVGDIVSRDVAMTAKVLQVANSAAFGVRVKQNDPIQATIYLGLEMIKGLALTVKVFTRFKESMLSVFPFKKLWDHSFRVGNYARVIAKLEGLDRKSVDDAFTGGLLHDLGQLVLSSNLAEEYCNVYELASQNEVPLWQMEMETFGATHSQVGAYLIGLWGLDERIFDVLLYHHTPDVHPDQSFSPLSAVHIANFLDAIRKCDGDEEASAPLNRYLESIGKAERLEAWRKTWSTLDQDING